MAETRFVLETTRQDLPSYRSMLRDEMMNRLQRNRSYSIRAFARDIELSSAYLSQILNNKRQLTEERGFQVAQKLNWPSERAHQFVSLIRFEKTKDPERRKEILEEAFRDAEPIHYLEDDIFQAMASWEYLAIIELAAAPHIKTTTRTISHKLGIPFIECQQYVDRLARIGLIVEDEGELRSVEKNIACREDDSMTAGKKYHAKILDLAKEKIWKTKPEQREFRSLIVSSSPDRMEGAKRRIRAFEESLMQYLESGERTALYQLSMQYFRLDKEDS